MEKLSFSELKTGLGLLAGKYGNVELGIRRLLAWRS